MLTEDFGIFFDTDDFASTASYTPDGGSAKEIKGIFDKEYLAGEIGEIEMMSAAPMFLTKTSDIPNENGTGTLVISGTTYKIVNVKPDGTGITMLILADSA